MQSEESFDSGPVESAGVAINKKHASQTVVLTSPQLDPSPSSLKTTPSPSLSKRERDRINNLAQKEMRMEEAGVTRLKYMQRIAEALEATKVVEVRDSQGNVKYETVPDVARNQWGVEMAAKLYGDMIERKELSHDLSEGALERFKKLSVAELKARALELVAGRPVSRLPVIDVEGGT